MHKYSCPIIRFWSRDLITKVLVLVSRPGGQGFGFGLETWWPRSWSWSRAFFKGLDNKSAYRYTGPCYSVDDALFRAICMNQNHVLQCFPTCVPRHTSVPRERQNVGNQKFSLRSFNGVFNSH